MTIASLPFPKAERKPVRFVLLDWLTLSQGDGMRAGVTTHNTYRIPPGTEVILMTGRDFGLCVLPESCPSPWGQRVFRY